MQAIIYEVTDTNVRGLVKNFHNDLHFGYAYETSTHYVHFYGRNRYFYNINTGQTVIENKSTSSYKTLTHWVEFYFGAKNIQTMIAEVGHSIDGVWRPGLYYAEDVYQALNTSEPERRLSDQALRVLLEKLDDLFLYVEPDTVSFNTYSHRIRELLILACTEVENFLGYYMSSSGTKPIGANYTTKDYVKLRDKLFLREFKCSLRSYNTISPILPFTTWDPAKPTTSLPWYDAYNRTKHNRAGQFSAATFLNALTAVVANLVLYMVRFSPGLLLEDHGTLNSLVNQHFKFELLSPDPRKSYVALLNVPSHYRTDIFLYDSSRNGDVQPFAIDKLVL
jgi:hypothetical protein